MINYYINYFDQKPNEFLYLTLASWITHNHSITLTLYINVKDDAKMKQFLAPFLDKINIIHTLPPDNYKLFPSFAVILNSFTKVQQAIGDERDPTFFKANDNFFKIVYTSTDQFQREIDIPTDVLLIPPSFVDLFPVLWEKKSILGYYWNLHVSPFLSHLSKVDSFSFCLYGSKAKYCDGMIHNIKIARELFPNFHIFLFVRNDVPEEYIDKYTQIGGEILHLYYIENFNVMMLYRLFLINHYQVKSVFSRDADSRLCQRDKQCIELFLENSTTVAYPNKNFQVIRDHYFHKSKIMGGTFGWKDIQNCQKPNMFFLFQQWLKLHSLTIENIQEYGTDEQFLQHFYIEYYNNLYIQTNITAYKNEITFKMPQSNQIELTHNFIGNTWEINNNTSYPLFSYYKFPVEAHIQWLFQENQWDILSRMELDGFYEWDFLKNFQNVTGGGGLYGLKNIIEYFYLGQINSTLPDSCNKARKLLGYFHNSVCMDENTYKNANKLFAKSAKLEGTRFIATTNPNRISKDSSECVIIYGDYPYYAKNLWTDKIPNRIYRNIMFYNENLGIPITWEYESCWEPIDRIYVLNLEDCHDRWIAVLGELAKMGAPLHRVHHYKAKRAQPRGDKLQIYSGATKNHCDCVKEFIESGDNYCLILEDDFMFCSDYENNKRTLSEFFKRRYDFDLCMISYSKIGTTEEKDDMIFLSRQACTTSSGYILKKSTAEKIYNVLFEGYTMMLKTGNYNTFCCDRYWSKIQKDDGFFLLKDKLGYQRIMYSNITGLQNMYLD